MNQNPNDSDQKRFAALVSNKASRKLAAKNNASPGIWFGLGMMGLIGWSIALPTLLGAASGIWLDQHYPEGRTYTMAFIIAGLCLGCFNAWHWVDKEHREMHALDNFDKASQDKDSQHE